MSARVAVALIVLVGLGCGHYTPPRQVLPPPPDPGIVYDAGQPILPDEEE